MINSRRFRRNLNLKNLDLIHSANTTSDQPKTSLKQLNLIS